MPVVLLNLQFHFLMREILNSNKNDHLSVTGWRTSNIRKNIALINGLDKKH